MSRKLNEYGEGCPFAKKAIDKGKVLGPIKGNQKVVLSMIDNWNDDYEVIVIEPHFWWENFGKWCVEQEEKFAVFDLTAIANVEKGFILIQRLSDLIKTGEYLRKETNYYDNYSILDWAQYHDRIKLSTFCEMEMRNENINSIFYVK